MQQVRLRIARPQMPDVSDIMGRFSECIENRILTNNGQYVQEFENELQRFFNSMLRPLTFCNGEMALYNLIRAYKIKYEIPDGAYCSVPSLTFVGTVNAIVANGLVPVFCDVDETLTVDEGAHGSSLMVAVGVYGNLPDMGFIKKAKEIMPVILDAAPAFGSKYDGQYPDKYCDCIYSFHATKKFSTMEGGCAVTNDPDIHDILFQLRDFGQVEKVHGEVIHPGLNGKMMEICAIVGIENLKTFRTNTGIARRYDEFFETIGRVITMYVDDKVECNYLFYPVIMYDVDSADGLIQHLALHGIESRKYYTACHDLAAYKTYKRQELQTTDKIKKHIVALPIHADMSDDDIQYLFQTIKEYFK